MNPHVRLLVGGRFVGLSIVNFLKGTERYTLMLLSEYWFITISFACSSKMSYFFASIFF